MKPMKLFIAQLIENFVVEMEADLLIILDSKYLIWNLQIWSE